MVCNSITVTCAPNWQCELPKNGWEQDGCGNRRENAACACATLNCDIGIV